MKPIATLLATLALAGLSLHANADPVPADMQTYYYGKSVVRDVTTRPSKVKSQLTIGLLDQDQAVLQFIGSDFKLDPIYGSTLYLPESNSLLVDFTDFEYSFTGILRVKGKPGKLRLSGTLNTPENFEGVFTTNRLNVKQIPK